LAPALGTIAVIVRQEIVLFIMGGVFVAETLSVMIRCCTSKWTGGKRFSAWRLSITTMSWRVEGEQVVVRFWIITMMLVPVRTIDSKLR